MTLGASYTVTYGGEVGVDVGVQLGGSSEASVSLSWSSTWGEERTIEQERQLSVADTIEITVGDDGQPVPYGLSTMSGTMTIEVIYDARIDGEVYAKWDTGWRGQYHHMLNLPAVLRDAGLSPVRQIRETVTIGFYTTGELWTRHR